MKKLNITLEKQNENFPEHIGLNLGISKLSDFIDLYFSAVEAFLKAKADDKIDISDLSLLGSFTVNLFSAFSDTDIALAEAKDLTDDEINILVSFADNYKLGSDVDKYKQILKIILIGFQTFTIFADS